MNKVKPDESEQWKDIKDYKGWYQVSNYGKVRSLDRFVNHNTSKTGLIFKEGKELIPRQERKGYMVVDLCRNRNKKAKKIHRLVAEAFIPNPNNLPQVNHIDGDKTNNNVNNLEWCDNSYNQIHAYKMGLNKHSKKAGRPRKQVVQKDIKTNEIINIFNSIAEAERQTKTHASSIRKVCSKQQKKANNFLWEYTGGANIYE